jgi:hypothetical protein
MNMRFLLLGIAVVLAFSAAHAQNDDEDLKRMSEAARKVADQLVSEIRGEVVKEMERGGPLRSVVVCKYSVPEITSTLSRKSGMRVSRVTLKPRNPALGYADAWEQKVLMDFDRRVQKGEKAENMEFAEIVTEPQGRYFRYLRAIPTQPVCLTCHGPEDSLSEAMRSQIASEYPHDPATGYAVGQVRGGVTVKRAL